VTVIVDASAVVGVSDAGEPRAAAIAAILRSREGPFIIPAPVTAEIDYLLGARIGPGAQRRFLEDLARPRFQVACLEPGEYQSVIELGARYRALSPGLADLSIVVLARRFNTRRILTFDERHFRAMTPLQGGEFEILPGGGHEPA
jgi:predicted nucleic acid-binding protein